MMRRNTSLFVNTLIILIAATCIIGSCIYFVTGISATIPPIQIYEYSGDSAHFIRSIYHFAASNPNLHIKETESVGTKENGYALYFTVITNSDSKNKYNFKVEKTDDNNPLSPTKISLIGLFDLTHNTGGYGKTATGMQKLLYNFNHGFLVDLKEKEHIVLKPQPVPRGWFLGYWN